MYHIYRRHHYHNSVFVYLSIYYVSRNNNCGKTTFGLWYSPFIGSRYNVEITLAIFYLLITL